MKESCGDKASCPLERTVGAAQELSLERAIFHVINKEEGTRAELYAVPLLLILVVTSGHNAGREGDGGCQSQ